MSQIIDRGDLAFGPFCVTTIGCLLLAPASALRQAGARAADPVVALVAKFDSSWNRKDTAAVSRLLAPRYQYFT